MSLKYLLLSVMVISTGLELASGQRVDDLLFAPEVLLDHRTQVGLSADQVREIRTLRQQAGPRADQYQQQVNAASGKLAELLAADRVDEAAALAQHKKLLAIENKLKNLRLRMLIQIRNQLDEEQLRAAARIRQRWPANGEVEQSLQAKAKRIDAEIRRRAESGQPPFEVARLMQRLPGLMRRGQVQAAVALLDRALGLLELDQAARTQEQRTPSRELSQPLSTDLLATARRRNPVTRLTPAELRAQVAAFRDHDVAWRKIEWKTCLLDGLRASREQEKPLMLWIFIDRPVDDERC